MAERASSFGGVASHYERYRPGPPTTAVEWLVPEHVARIVDLGAGTGALTRLLVDRADEVVAVEPDDRMRAVLTEQVPGARALHGRGESIPVPDGAADAVLASSSWHWMDPVPTLAEVARVLVPGGTLGALWTGPDDDGAFMVEARRLLAEQSARAAAGDGAAAEGDGLAGILSGEETRVAFGLELPDGVPFTPPEHEQFRFEVALTADDLIGLLGTLSWLITMPAEQREDVLTTARRLLRELLGLEGPATVDVTFLADAWRTRFTG